MVRLKAKFLYLPPSFLQISIPYGSIKSALLTAVNTIFIVISIPYGSIKRPVLQTKTKHPFIDFNSLWFD